MFFYIKRVDRQPACYDQSHSLLHVFTSSAIVGSLGSGQLVISVAPKITDPGSVPCSSYLLKSLINLATALLTREWQERDGPSWAAGVGLVRRPRLMSEDKC